MLLRDQIDSPPVINILLVITIVTPRGYDEMVKMNE
jgi:hypothetical protein